MYFSVFFFFYVYLKVWLFSCLQPIFCIATPSLNIFLLVNPIFWLITFNFSQISFGEILKTRFFFSILIPMVSIYSIIILFPIHYFFSTFRVVFLSLNILFLFEVISFLQPMTIFIYLKFFKMSIKNMNSPLIA